MWWGRGCPGRPLSLCVKDLKAAKELTERAGVDLEALQELVGNPSGLLTRYSAPWPKQAAEKSMKAWLALLGKRYPLTHNLDQLALELRDAGERVLRPPGTLEALNPFAVQFRYESMGLLRPRS